MSRPQPRRNGGLRPAHPVQPMAIDRAPFRRVLVIDDEPITRELLSALLDQQGFDPVVAESARAGLAALQANDDIHVVICDWQMPGENGDYFAEQLRAGDWGHYVYLVILTANGDSDTRLAALHAGADDLMTKPANPGLVAARMTSALRFLATDVQLRARERDLREANERMAGELALASTFQEALLPKDARIDGIDLKGRYVSAAWLSGDCFGFHRRAGGGAFFFIADVAGHGVKAALLGATLAALLRPEQIALVDDADSPSAIAAYLNDRLCQTTEDEDFATAIIGHIAPDGRVRLCHAGHPSAVLLAADGPRLLSNGGFPLGMLDSATYEDTAVSIAPGQALVLISDGITEAEDPDGRPFGDHGMLPFLAGSATRAVNLGDGLINASVRWTDGRIDDDMTVLTISRPAD